MIQAQRVMISLLEPTQDKVQRCFESLKVIGRVGRIPSFGPYFFAFDTGCGLTLLSLGELDFIAALETRFRAKPKSDFAVRFVSSVYGTHSSAPHTKKV